MLVRCVIAVVLVLSDRLAYSLRSVQIQSSRNRLSFHNFNYRLSAQPDSYREALERAKAAKLQQGGKVIPPPAAPVRPTAVVATPATPVVSSVSSSSSSIEADNGLPFSDDMYDHLKFVIGKLSARMKSDTPLTRDELARFQNSCENIIQDAWADFRGSPST
jgi:hypothetical protein